VFFVLFFILWLIIPNKLVKLLLQLLEERHCTSVHGEQSNQLRGLGEGRVSELLSTRKSGSSVLIHVRNRVSRWSNAFAQPPGATA
jgi:hypothetical protein